MDIIVLLIFITLLIVCVAAKLSLLAALLAGYVIFFIYSVKKGFSAKAVIEMSFDGIKKAKNILITFMLIGILTALWRAAGTIPAIVSYSTGIMMPRFMILLTFLLNCLVSFLTGTAFGTAATMGVICITVSSALGINPIISGGAVLSGAYFGDRCSPVSTSALLVSELTGTDLYINIKNMLKTAVFPFVISCIFYTASGFMSEIGNTDIPDIHGIFASEFNMNLLTVIPAILILILSLARLNVKTTMLASIVCSWVLCITCQDLSAADILRFSVFGFETDNPAVSAMINGGGIVSMLKVAAIVCIFSSYSGIFEKTGLLKGVGVIIERLGKKLSPFTVTALTSVAASMVACNQTLAIILTNQLCRHLEKDRYKFATYLENSAVVIAPLIPWSIAGGVPLASVGAPTEAIAAAVFLWILPLWGVIMSFVKKKRIL